MEHSVMICEGCAACYINGVKCHERGCPEAWREPRACLWCGSVFVPPNPYERCCCEGCAQSYS